VLDWYDGPREGFVELSRPVSAWYFQLMAERSDPDDADHRLYLLSEVPGGVIDLIAGLVGGADRPAALGTWVPAWQFSDPAGRQAADDAVEKAIREAESGSVVVRSQDLTRVDDFWLTTTEIRLPRDAGPG